jgi:hypothetical protein
MEGEGEGVSVANITSHIISSHRCTTVLAGTAGSMQNVKKESDMYNRDCPTTGQVLPTNHQISSLN